jgi:Rod binding domain-containing protein
MRADMSILSQKSFPQNEVSKNADKAKMLEVAKKFESSFIAEMFAKIGMPSTGFDDNSVTQNFSSFLSKAYADALVDRGGVGMAGAIAESLYKKSLGENL